MTNNLYCIVCLLSPNKEDFNTPANYIIAGGTYCRGHAIAGLRLENQSGYYEPEEAEHG